MTVNKAIRKLVYYDFITNFAFGLLSPILAVFVLNNIAGGTLKTVGLATTFYWLARVTTTVPLGRFMDKTDGERDEFYFAVVGSFIMSSVPLFYLLADQPWHMYLIQFLLGLANSMAVPAWRILFADHLDKGMHAFEWSLDDVGIGIAVGASAYIGSALVERFGFHFVFILLSMLGYCGTIMMMTLDSDARTLKQMARDEELERIRARRREAHVKAA